MKIEKLIDSIKKLSTQGVSPYSPNYKERLIQEINNTMSGYMNVTGFREADEKFKEMKLIWMTCEKTGVSIPDEVEKFFGGESPEDIDSLEVNVDCATKEWRAEMKDGYEIDLSKLPPDLKKLRVYMAY